MPTIEEPIEIENPAEVSLYVDDGGHRGADADTGGVGVGCVRLRNWKMHPVRGHTTGEDSAAFLVKINYELVLEPDAVPLSWFEIGFEFEDAPITVVDAIPRLVTTAEQPRSFDLDDHLDLVAGQAIHLPATHPSVHLFGVGGAEVRWRHSSRLPDGVSPGAYTAWLTLVVPRRRTPLRVEVSARFDVPVEEALFYQPGRKPVQLTVPLPEPAPDTPSAPPSAVAPATKPHDPRIFISYAWDDSDHLEAVLRFAEFLVRDVGLDVHLDRWDVDRRRDWYNWAIGELTSADFVIVIASPLCREVGDGKIDSHRNRGLQSEIAIVKELLHTDRREWTTRLLPVVLPGHSIAEIPVFLQPLSADHYTIDSLDVAGAEDLIRVLTARIRHPRPRRRDTILELPTA
ncbi:SEFIR domain-containing protein [Nocardia bovistercoris]|uniref:TIR domain-containing protein n=1 Tax=Nocardia bovistercoris TaxID=2785916 RepID=A0A931IB15_9NOCA|nr:SEFIR domain-containing protein [Nocardia bovistercoris]MBH0776590.1 TIR domain-containing protein [Nocardia bovistercoris]